MSKRGGYIRSKQQYFLSGSISEIVLFDSNSNQQAISTPMDNIHRGFDIKSIIDIVNLDEERKRMAEEISIAQMAVVDNLSTTDSKQPLPPAPGSIEDEIIWGMKQYQISKYAFEKFKPFLHQEVAGEYTDKRKTWDKDTITLFDKLFDYSEIDQYVMPHKKIIEALDQSVTDDKIERILKSVREYIFAIQSHPFNFKNLHRYAQPQVFKDYDNLSKNLALSYDTIDQTSDHIRKTKIVRQFELQIEEFFKKKKLIHEVNKEKEMGMALAARKVMSIYKKGKKPPATDSRTDSICYLDYDHLSIPRLMADPNVYGSDKTITDIQASPEYFFKYILSTQLNNIKDILKANFSIKILSMITLNYREWTIDLIRYIREISAFRKNPEIFDNKDIFKPLPLRLVFRYRIPNLRSFHAFSSPAQAIDSQYGIATNQASPRRDEILKLLWDDKAILKPLREMPFREELAYQLWDIAYYAGSLDPVYDTTSSSFKDPDIPITIADRRKVMHYFNYYGSSSIMSGKVRNGDSPIIIARKIHREDYVNLDEIGWFVAYAKR